MDDDIESAGVYQHPHIREEGFTGNSFDSLWIFAFSEFIKALKMFPPGQFSSSVLRSFVLRNKLVDGRN